MSTENLQQLQETVINNINEIMLENRVILNDYQKSKRFTHFFLIISLLLNISLCGYFFSFSSFDNFSTLEDINYVRTRAQIGISYRRYQEILHRNNHGGHATPEMTDLIYGDIQTIKDMLLKGKKYIHGSTIKIEGFELVDRYVKSKSYLVSSIEKFDFNIKWLDVFMKSELYNQAVIFNDRNKRKQGYSSNVLFLNTLYKWLYTDEGQWFIKNGDIILPERTIIDPEITDHAYQQFKSVKDRYNKHPSTTNPIRERVIYDPEYDFLELREYEFSRGPQQQFLLSINGNDNISEVGNGILYNDKGNIINFPHINGFDKEQNHEFWYSN